MAARAVGEACHALKALSGVDRRLAQLERPRERGPTPGIAINPPTYIQALVVLFNAISPDLGQQALQLSALYDPQINKKVEWYVDPSLNLRTRPKTGAACN